jgi:prepilin-type N-terminal cleavage/methylation domain-containing protein
MRLVTLHPRERGDTLIEVLFAVAVFSMIAVGCLSIMNLGTSISQRALEITLVREQIDAQAEAIRYIHQAYVETYQSGGTPTGAASQWSTMTNIVTGKGADTPSVFGQTDNGQCPATVPGEKPFILNARTATVSSTEPTMSPPTDGSLPPFAEVVYNSDSSIAAAYGLWVEAVPSTNADGPGFVDFHIRACWDGPGSGPAVTLGTIVRLYDPR